MRTPLLLALAFTAGAWMGWGAEHPRGSVHEETASTGRDLTLQAPRVPAAEVASAIELGRPEPAPAPARAHHRPATAKPAPRAPAAEPVAEPATVPTVAMAAVPEAAAEPAPAPVDDAAAGGRELAPGKTVTIIPVSSGPSVEADPGDSWVPSEPQRGVIMGGGGTCRRRGGGGGIGIAARFPVGAFSPRLR